MFVGGFLVILLIILGLMQGLNFIFGLYSIENNKNNK